MCPVINGFVSTAWVMTLFAGGSVNRGGVQSLDNPQSVRRASPVRCWRMSFESPWGAPSQASKPLLVLGVAQN